MRETPADTSAAISLALLFHITLFLVMWLGLRWTEASRPLSVAGAPVEAELVISAADSKRAQATIAAAPKPTPTPKPPEPQQSQQPEAAPPPQPKPEPSPQTAQTPPQQELQEQVPNPDTQNQERAALLAIQQEQERLQKEQQERVRQEQIELEAQKEKQREAEQRQRLAAQQQEKLQQLAKLRQQRQEAEKQTRMEQQRLEQLRDRAIAAASPQATPSNQPPTPAAGNYGTDDSLQAQYVFAIQQAVERNWIRPETVPADTPCKLQITQIPGGEVISADVVAPCPFDEIGKRSLEAAVLRAQPLPYSGFESVFSRQLIFTFRAPQD